MAQIKVESGDEKTHHHHENEYIFEAVLQPRRNGACRAEELGGVEEYMEATIMFQVI